MTLEMTSLGHPEAIRLMKTREALTVKKKKKVYEENKEIKEYFLGK